MLNAAREKTQLAAMGHQRTAAFERHRDVEHDEIPKIDELLDILGADVERPLQTIHVRERPAARGAQAQGNFSW